MIHPEQARGARDRAGSPERQHYLEVVPIGFHGCLNLLDPSSCWILLRCILAEQDRRNSCGLLHKAIAEAGIDLYAARRYSRLVESSESSRSTMILKLHHAAYRCRNSEETRRFYEDFLGLPLVESLLITQTQTGRSTRVLHTFYRLDDGSHLAFFEVPESPFDFKAQHDFDLHIALEVAPATLESMQEKGRASRIETRGIAEHSFIRSIYFRDPNGYVIELCTPQSGSDATQRTPRAARDDLDRWMSETPH